MQEDRANEQFPVVIIGAGLAGLTAALHLAERGIAPLVLEADQLYAGGRLSGGDPETFAYDGREWSFPSEHGIHALWGGYVNMRATLERFVDVELVASPGEMWINRWGYDVRRIEAGSAVRSRWLPAPFHYLQLLFRPRFWTTITPLDFLSLPGFLVSILLTVGFDPIREKRALDGLLIKEYFGGWTPNLKATFIGLGKNLLAAPKEQISLTAFIAAIRFYTMLNREAWHPYFLPDDSNTALIARMVAKLECLGGRVIYGATAQALQRMDNGWRVRVEDAPKRGMRSVEAEHVILALNAPAAERLLCASEDTADEASKLRFPGGLRTTTVRLWFSKTPTEAGTSGMFTGDFTFDNFFWLDQMQPAFVDWREAAGGSAIELHLYGTDKQNDQSDSVLMRQAQDEVERAYPSVRGSLVHSAIRRNSKTHTEFRVPTVKSLHVNTPYDGVFACGDWIGYETPSLWMERACTTGIAAANEVLKEYGRPLFALRTPQKADTLARGISGAVYGGRKVLGAPITLLARSLKRRKG
jgi:carotenoid phi-ring synthase / carotenoid chi-ring synthase